MRHHEQKEALFARLAAEFINTESNRQSLITITRGKLSDDERRADLFFTVLPESKEEEVGIFLMRNRGPFRDYVKKHSESIRVLPTFDFKLDVGEKNRLDLEALSNKEVPLE